MRKKEAKDPTSDYAERVRSGEIVACRWVRMACERHREDLKRKDLIWDLEAALFKIGFFRDVLKLSAGQFEGKPFVLEPFEEFIIGSLFGWKMRDGNRRYQIAYVEEAKGNGKSALAAGIGHCMMLADGESRAEIYVAATKKDQAMNVFRPAVAMCDQSPHLAARLTKSGVLERCWNLADAKSNSFFRPISSEDQNQSGPSPHCALVDEVHEHKNSVVIDMLSAGFKWRRQPLMFMITNSGFDREGVCWRYHEYGTRILKRTAENDRLFVFICALDSCEKHWKEGQEQPVDNCLECDDWRVEGPHWLKANPNLGVSIAQEYLRNQVRKGLDMPAEENTVRRLNFCYWTNQATRWLSMQAWDSCWEKIDYEALRGRSCIVGIDLANKIDIASVCLLFPPSRLVFKDNAVQGLEGEDKTAELVLESTDEFVVLPFFWIPKDTILEAMRRDDVPYDAWVRDGLIEAPEGAVIDFEAIKRRLVAINTLYPIQSVFTNGARYHLAGFDPWGATEFANDMARDHNIKMIEVRQGYQTLSEPTKQMARLIRAKKLRHGGHPVLRWMADNVMVRTDPAGNVKPDKERSKKKIDGIVAMIIAFALAIRHPGAGAGSVYDRRGLLTL